MFPDFQAKLTYVMKVSSSVIYKQNGLGCKSVSASVSACSCELV